MAVVSTGRLLSEGSFPLIVGTLARDRGRMPSARSCPRARASWWPSCWLSWASSRLRAVVACSLRSREASLLRWRAGTDAQPAAHQDDGDQAVIGVVPPDEVAGVVQLRHHVL